MYVYMCVISIPFSMFELRMTGDWDIFPKIQHLFFEHFRRPNLMFCTTPASLWFFIFFTPFVWNRPNS